ncbi:MAG: P-loop NTPase, partial [Thermoguttaceae bacterium]|nr:P-loop NTPase [Thermoguttaceae bacterium]
YVDMPPGTGDVPLTVFQSFPLQGIVVVATPQDLVSLIVEKAIKMAKTMNVPVLALVENMSYYDCPDCGKRLEIFGKSKIDEIAKEYGIETVVKLPIDPKIAAACDAGKIESIQAPQFDELFAAILKNAEEKEKAAK